MTGMSRRETLSVLLHSSRFLRIRETRRDKQDGDDRMKICASDYQIKITGLGAAEPSPRPLVRLVLCSLFSSTRGKEHLLFASF